MFSLTPAGASVTVTGSSTSEDTTKALDLLRAHQVSQITTDQSQISKTFEFENSDGESCKISLTPLQEDFSTLLRNYNALLTKVMWDRKIINPNVLINSAYARLKAFVDEHPEFSKILPTKIKITDDQNKRSITIDFAEDDAKSDT